MKIFLLAGLIASCMADGSVVTGAGPSQCCSGNVVYANSAVIVQSPPLATTGVPKKKKRAGMKRKIFLDMIRAGYMSYLEEKLKAKRELTNEPNEST